jgi:hypothetical protein
MAAPPFVAVSLQSSLLSSITKDAS